MNIKIAGKWPINLPNDRFNFHTQRTQWEVSRVDSIIKNIKNGDVLVDVGTEVGDYAALFTLNGASVFCIEPQPLYWPTIKSIFDMNKTEPLGCFAGFACNVTSDPIQADFDTEYTGIWPNVSLGEVKDWHGFRNVIETGVCTPQRRIDDLLSERKLKANILNIDVEGAEFEVLKGSITTLNVDKPLVYLSLHAEMLMHDWSNSPEDIFNYMRELGYKWAFLGSDHEEHYVFFRESHDYSS